MNRSQSPTAGDSESTTVTNQSARTTDGVATSSTTVGKEHQVSSTSDNDTYCSNCRIVDNRPDNCAAAADLSTLSQSSANKVPDRNCCTQLNERRVVCPSEPGVPNSASKITRTMTSSSANKLNRAPLRKSDQDSNKTLFELNRAREKSLITTLRKCDQDSAKTLYELRVLYDGNRKLKTKEQRSLKGSAVLLRKLRKESTSLIRNVSIAFQDIVKIDPISQNMRTGIFDINGRTKLMSSVRLVLVELKRVIKTFQDADVKQQQDFSKLAALSQERQTQVDQVVEEECRYREHMKTYKSVLADVEDLLLRWQSDLHFEINLKQERLSCSVIKNFEYCVDKIVKLIDECDESKDFTDQLKAQLNTSESRRKRWSQVRQDVESEFDQYKTILASFTEKFTAAEPDANYGSYTLARVSFYAPSSFSKIGQNNGHCASNNSHVHYAVYDQSRNVYEWVRKRLDTLVTEISKNKECLSVLDRSKTDLDQKLCGVSEKWSHYEKELLEKKTENSDLMNVVDEIKKKRAENIRRLKVEYLSVEHKKVALHREKEMLSAEVTKIDACRREIEMSSQKLESRRSLLQTDLERMESQITTKLEMTSKEFHNDEERVNELTKKLEERVHTKINLNRKMSTFDPKDDHVTEKLGKYTRQRNKLRESCVKLRRLSEQRVENKNNIQNQSSKLASEISGANCEHDSLTHSIHRAFRLNGILIDRLGREEKSLSALRDDLAKLMQVQHVFQEQRFQEQNQKLIQSRQGAINEVDLSSDDITTGFDACQYLKGNLNNHALIKGGDPIAGQSTTKLRKFPKVEDLRQVSRNVPDNVKCYRNSVSDETLTKSSSDAKEHPATIQQVAVKMCDPVKVRNNVEVHSSIKIVEENVQPPPTTCRSPETPLALETAEQYVRRRSKIPTTVKRCAIRKPSTILFPSSDQHFINQETK